MSHDLLPSNATAFERAFSLSTDESGRVSPGVARMRTAKRVSIPESFLPFLIYEYGLGEVSPYVRDHRKLLISGVDWQRVRGTPEALSFALGWLGYSAALEEASTERARWNIFQLGLNSIPASDDDLERIEAVSALSVPARSKFWRGYRGYDVRELVWSGRRWSGGAWSSSSGARLRPDGAKWSFGRPREFIVPLPQTDLEALGVWQASAGGSLGWGDFSWEAVDASWINVNEMDRVRAISQGLSSRRIYLALRDGDGELIGYRRARAVHPVSLDALGPYRVGTSRLSVDTVSPIGLYVEFVTGFGDGAGRRAKSATPVWDATPQDVSRPGLLWGEPEEIFGGTEVAETSVDIPLSRTVREQFRFLFTF